MKKFYVYLFMLMSAMMLSSGACSSNAEDEPEQTEPGVFNNLKKCPIDGIYKGEILDLSYPDNDGYDGIWCYVTDAPQDAVSKKAPCLGSYIFFERSDFEGIELPIGETIAFRILKYEVDTYRYHNWLLFKYYYYYNCKVKPI